MSGLAGVWWRGRGPAGDPGQGEPPRAVALLAAGLSRRAEAAGTVLRGMPGPSGEGPWMVHRPFPADAGPLSSAADAGLLVAFDGRLDGRADLVAALALPATAGDAQLTLAAYRRWGEAVVERLLGDFAFALWDGRAGRLLLARDPSGLRPLFVHLGAGRLAWASTLSALSALPEVGRRPDERWIAGYLAGGPEPCRSPLADVAAVPPGGTLSIGAGDEREIAGWRPGPRQPLRWTDDRDYEARFRDLFAAAVGDRLRGGGPVGAELSGGLDSSAVACVAAERLRLAGRPPGDLLTVSHVFDRSPGSDERAFVAVVERATGCRGHHLAETAHPLLADLAEPFFELPTPLHCTHRRERAVVERLRSAGATVVLGGQGGDELLWSEVELPVAVADALARGRLGAARTALAARSRETGQSWPEVAFEAFVVLAPYRLRARYRRSPADRLPWIDRRFARRTGLGERFLGLAAGMRFPSPSQREHCELILDLLRLTPWLYDGGPRPLDRALPCLDRRLIDFCLALPFDQLSRGGLTRSILRRALAGVLPPAIAARRGKKALDEAALRAFAARWGEVRAFLGAEPRVVAHGIAEPRALSAALEAARFGRAVGTVALFQLLGLEAWLRSLERPAAVASS